jgi:hypothetical protein
VAESWIKMRGSLVTNPRVIRIARLLLDDPEFLEWYGSTFEAVTASTSVTRRHVTVVTRVTVGALVPLWSGVNECAGNEGLLPGATLFEIDEMAGVPGLGRAMEVVGWLEVEDGVGIRLPNFTEHNTVEKQRKTGAKTDAERAKEYRDRKAQKADEGGPGGDGFASETVTNVVTEKRDASRDTVTTEKRREEKKTRGAKAPLSADELPTWMTDLLSLYHEVLPELPGVRLMDAARHQALSDFRAWVLTTKKPDGSPRAANDAELLTWARDYFERARHNDFIMGRGHRSEEHKNWRCSIEFLLSAKGMKKVIEETKVPA